MRAAKAEPNKRAEYKRLKPCFATLIRKQCANRCTLATSFCAGVKRHNWREQYSLQRKAPAPSATTPLTQHPDRGDDVLQMMLSSSKVPRRLASLPRRIAVSCQQVGTMVGFTLGPQKSTLCLSSSGGGLFGRPMTRKGRGRFLFGGFLTEVPLETSLAV